MSWLHRRLPIMGNRLFIKILLYFLSLLIPIVIIGLFVYHDVNRLAQTDVTQKLVNNLRSSAQSIDMHLGMAQSINNNLLLGDMFQRHLKAYTMMSDADKMNMQLIVRAITANQNTFSSFVDSMFVYIDTHKVYTSEGVIDFATFFEKFYRTDELDAAFWSQHLRTTGFYELFSPVTVLNYDGKARVVVPNVTTQYVSGRLATMVTNLSAEAGEQALTSNSLYDTTHFVVLEQEGQVIVNTGIWSGDDIARLHETWREADNGSVFTEVGGVPMLLVHISSDDFGWDYYAFTPRSSFSHEARSILNLVVAICVILMLVGVALSFVFSVNLYNPIRNIHAILRGGAEGGKAGAVAGKTGGRRRDGDELKLIGSRVHELVQQRRETEDKLSRYSTELLDQWFANLIKGTPLPTQSVAGSMLETLGFVHGQYLCCCFIFQYKDVFIREIQETERLLIQEKMKNVLWGILQPHVNGYLTEYEQHVYVCVVHLRSDEERAELDRALEQVKQTFAYDQIYCELTIGIGKVYDKPQDAAKSYSDALTAIHARASGGKLQMIDAEDLTIEGTYYYSFLDEKKLVNIMKAGNEQALDTEVRELVQLNINRNVAHGYLVALLVEVAGTGLRYLNERGVSRERVVTDERYTALTDRSLSPHELEERTEQLLDFLRQAMRETTARSESKKTDSVAQLTERYIEEHYMDDIYLEKIAHEIGLSAKYVSRMFRETTGITITDYINTIRMNKAKELLEQTELKVNEIAERVGIASRTTFLRVFKKQEGVSPTDFRAMRRKEAGLQ